MIYTVNLAMNEADGTYYVIADQASVPITVEEMTVTTQPEEAAITVLDLSNPRDLTMVTEAGYSMEDFSASMHSTDSSSGSSDAFSVTADDLSMSDVDPEIARAAVKSAQSGTLTPLIKKEIKYSIQHKRLKAGKGILKVENTEKRRREELTPMDEDRRDRRRERNKVAAQKCRAKRQIRADELDEEATLLINKNGKLKDEIDTLETEREMLTNMLRTHDICPRTCNTRLSTCSDDEANNSKSASPRHMTFQDPNELGVELELEIDSCQPESPFNVDLIGADHVFIN